MPSLMRDTENDEDAQFVPEVFELQLNHVVSRKGYLNFLEENSSGWIKRYVVSVAISYHQTLRGQYCNKQ